MPRRPSNEAGCGGALSDLVKSSEMEISERSSAALDAVAVTAVAAATPAPSVDFFRKARRDTELDVLSSFVFPAGDLVSSTLERAMINPYCQLGVRQAEELILTDNSQIDSILTVPVASSTDGTRIGSLVPLIVIVFACLNSHPPAKIAPQCPSARTAAASVSVSSAPAPTPAQSADYVRNSLRETLDLAIALLPVISSFEDSGDS